MNSDALELFFDDRWHQIPLLIAAHAGFASDPARLTQETLSFQILSTSNWKNEKHLGFFFIYPI